MEQGEDIGLATAKLASRWKRRATWCLGDLSNQLSLYEGITAQLSVLSRSTACVISEGERQAPSPAFKKN